MSSRLAGLGAGAVAVPVGAWPAARCALRPRMPCNAMNELLKIDACAIECVKPCDRCQMMAALGGHAAAWWSSPRWARRSRWAGCRPPPASSLTAKTAARGACAPSRAPSTHPHPRFSCERLHKRIVLHIGNCAPVDPARRVIWLGARSGWACCWLGPCCLAPAWSHRQLWALPLL